MPSIPPTPGLAPQPNALLLGPIRIEWAPWVSHPIAVDHAKLNGTCVFVTECPITFSRVNTNLTETIPARFPFDGASIPRWLWWIPGFAPIGMHLWAALLHDWLCIKAQASPELMDRELADAVFASLLKHTQIGWRATAMDFAVSGYRRFNWLRGVLRTCAPKSD